MIRHRTGSYVNLLTSHLHCSLTRAEQNVLLAFLDFFLSNVFVLVGSILT